MDPNMQTALRWANEIEPPPSLPLSLIDINERANLVQDIDKPNFTHALFNDYFKKLGVKEKNKQLNEIAKISKEYMPDIDYITRINVSLRLWSGCLSGAKTIALETHDGPNTPEIRSAAYNYIKSIAQNDNIYKAGAEASHAFKELRKEKYSFVGLPPDSFLLKK